MKETKIEDLALVLERLQRFKAAAVVDKPVETTQEEIDLFLRASFLERADDGKLVLTTAADFVLLLAASVGLAGGVM